MNEPLLQIQNLSVSFKTEDGIIQAVKDSSFNINRGEITAIVGESGSGKSITSLAIMQLLPKNAAVKGDIFFNNDGQVNLQKLSSKQINNFRGKNIAMIFQEPMTSLNPVLTCGSQVMEAIVLHKKISKAKAKQEVIELFEKVKLPQPEKIFDRYPHQLSGGQKQRVMIAMAISCGPSLLIADEPTTALDVTVQKAILELIKELQQQTEMAVMLITHDLGVAADIADKILVMRKGEIVERGNAMDVLQDPQNDYTKNLLNSRVEDRRLTMDDELPTMNNTQPVLKVENLDVIYHQNKKLFGKAASFKAVENVSFEIYKGETVGLVGESGCGKTTVGRAILQLVPATSGKIILNGIELVHLSKKQMRPLRKNLQIVFQDPYGSLNPGLTIGEAILEPMNENSILTSTNRRKERIIELLEKVNLEASDYNKYPHQFSGGQRQRICIARALALDPSFLIFDESVSALDVSIQAQVLHLLAELKKEFGFTSIFISHDLSIVHSISDRIMVMSKGRIIETGTADEIYFSPKNVYTRTLIEAIPGKKLANFHNR